jgi:hypothetical protein
MKKQEWLNVQVIAIEIKLGQRIEERRITYKPYGSEETTKYGNLDPNEPRRTLVLYTANGELKTKEFEGEWTLEQVNAWSKERFVEDE